MSKKTPTLHVDPVPSTKANKSRPVIDEEMEEEAEFNLVDVMNDMTPSKRRDVYALRGLWEDYKALRKELREKLAELKISNVQARSELFAKREAIVTGAREVTEEEVQEAKKKAKEGDKKEEEEDEEVAALPSSSTPAGKSVKVVAPSDEVAKHLMEASAADAHGGIPNFWLTAMCNSDVVEEMITERDRPALAFLTDIATEYVDGDPHKGVRLVFSFAPNEYFKNPTLTKTYRMSFNEEEGELEVEKIEGCDIDWTSKANNLTITIKEKKQRNKKTNQIRIVEREEPCMSFFNFFTPPKEEGEDDDHESDDDEDVNREQEWEMDMEAGQELMEQIVPKAVFFYVGKSVEEVAEMMHSQYGGMDDEEDEEDEEEEEDHPKQGGGSRFGAVQNFSRGGGMGAGGRGRGGSNPGKDECKQQ